MTSVENLIKRRILIVGATGMLGQRIAQFYKDQKDIELLCVSAEECYFESDVEYKQMDITDKNSVKKIILDFFPDVVINAAAYTNVDRAETEKELAWKINVSGVEYLALYSWTIDAQLIHISTDYLFDGKEGPYSETDIPSPVGYYGRTKMASENSIKISGVRAAIIRTNVLYGPAKYGRPDFVKWVIDSLKNGKPINIVTDQYNNPTYIDDIVKAIISLVELKKEGVYNIGGDEVLNRYEFTLRIADYFGLDKKLINPILTKELNQPAPRPLKSGLITLKAQIELGYKPRKIEETFRLFGEELGL
ncbi:MAG: dTDP-4-dehydrorhamnose reductase [Melioribacteraceae bacterium]